MKNNLPSLSKVSIKRTQTDNVYDPVLYMLKRQRFQIGGTFDGKINDMMNEGKEGGELIREDNYLLVQVEGDQYRNHFLYYGDNHLLMHYVCIHKETGKTEQYDLIWGAHMILERYDYKLVSEGDDEADLPTDDDEWYWMNGEYVDDDLLSDSTEEEN